MTSLVGWMAQLQASWRHTGHWRMVNTDIADSRRGPASNRVRSIQNNPGNTIKYICLKWISSESVFNSEIWESLWWFIAHREQGGGHERPRSLHLNIGQLSRRELSLNADSGFLCYEECCVTEWRWWDGVVRTLPTPGLLGTSQTQTDSIWQLLGESWVRGSWGEQSQQWYTDTVSTFCGEFPCFREAGPSPQTPK